MKTKQLIILAVLAVLLIAFYIFQRCTADKTETQSSVQTGAYILPEDFTSEAIASVEIKSKGGTVTLDQQQNGWTVRERDNYPADFSNLKTLFVALCDTRVAQSLTLNDAQKADLQLDDQATVMTITGKDGAVLQTIAFGRKHETKNDDEAQQNPYLMMAGGGNTFPSGRFIRLQDGSCITVANTFARIDDSLSDWLNPDFFKVSAAKSIILKDSDGNLMWKAQRNDKAQDFTIDYTEIPDGMEEDKTRFGMLKSLFNWTRFSDVLNAQTAPDAVGMVKYTVIEITDFEDIVYTVSFGSIVNGKQYMKVGIAWNGKVTRQPAADEKPEDKEKNDKAYADAIASQQKKAQELNSQFATWLYQVEPTMFSSIPKTREAFFKKIEEKKDDKQ